MRTHGRSEHGFTLIELMIVVAIIGCLSSVAIPNFKKFSLRAKKAERGLVVNAMEKGLIECYYQRDRWPLDWGTPTDTYVWGEDQPDWSPGTTKRAFRTTLQGWKDCGIRIQGSLYYTYGFWGSQSMAWWGMNLWSWGDLDGDFHWQNLNQSWDMFQGVPRKTWEWPLPGMDDNIF